MLPGGLDRRNVASVLLALVLLMSCLGTGIAFASPGGSNDRSAASQGGSSPESGAVHPDLRDAEGEVTVVVRFPELGNDRARARSSRERGMRMRSHATDSQAAFDEFVADRDGVGVVRSFWVANAKLVTVDTDAVALADLAAVEGVREIHPNYRMEATSAAATAPPDGSFASSGSVDHDYATTDGVEQVRAPEVWERFGTKGAGVSVAVLDTGVDPSHPDVDVPPERWAEFDDGGNRVDSTPYDSAEHGTHTSGTVAGGNASGEYIGVAPEATLYHGKVLHEGAGSWAGATAGIQWAATEAEVDVISMSLGGENNPSLIEPIRRANELGVIVVASAGNDGPGTSGSPGNLHDTVAVGAVDRNREVADFSSGERIDTSAAWGSDAPSDWPEEYVVPNVAAPGESVLSAAPDGGYRYMSGTSMAAPHVAGTVALVQAAGGDDLTQAEMRDLLERTADHPDGDRDGLDTRYGAGVVDAYEATVHGASDSAVTGRVVDVDGTPVPSSRVDTEFDYGTETDANGSYSLAVPSLEQTLTVDAFGFAPRSFVVAPNAETLSRDLAVTDPTLAARAETAPPDRLDPGETATHEFAVSNVTAVTVETLDGTSVERGDVTLRIEGEPVAFGEPRTFDEPQTNAVITVEVETTADTIGALELEHTFEDGTASVTRTTARTHVHPDPLRLPTDYDPADLQSAVDVAAPNTTLVVDERPAGPYVLPVDGSTPTASGLSMTRPITLRGADGATPAFAVADHDGTETSVVGLDVASPGVEVRGIELDANGAAVGVRTVDGTTLADATVSNASVAVEFRGDTRARNVSFGDGRLVDVHGTDVALSSTEPPAAPPEHHELIGPAVAVESVGSGASATLSVASDVDATRLRNDSLGLWRYDESSDEWTPVADTGLDATTGRITATLDSFGAVAPMGEQRPAEFVVDDVATSSAVVAGEELTVDAAVTNRGVKTATQDVDLLFDGEVVASASVSLAEGETRRLTFSHVVDATRSSGTVSHGVRTADDSNLVAIDVSEPARFDVRDLEAPGAVERADPLVVNATVENTGDFDDAQRLELRLGSDLDGDASAGDYDVLASANRSLGAGDETTVSFAVDVPADADTGALEVGVFSEDADARTAIDVSRISGTLEGRVSNAATLDPLADVSVTATNRETGETFATTTDADGGYALRLPVGNYSVAATVDGYGRTEATDVDVADDESTSVDLGLRQSAVFFDVGDLAVPTSAEAGTAFDVTATVTNLGHSAGERSVALLVDGRPVTEETVRLAAGAEQTVAFSHVADAGGFVDVAMASADASAEGTIEIEARESTDDGDSGGSSGGGGSGGSGGGAAAPAPPAPPAPPAEEDVPPEDEADDAANETDATPAVYAETAAIVDSDPDRPGVTVPIRNTSVSEITFSRVDAAGSVTVSEGVVDDLPAPPGTALAQLSIEVPAGLADRPATIRSTVDSAAVGADDLTMYRYADGEWRSLETTVAATDGRLLVAAETPGFSRFALVRTGAQSTPVDARSVTDDGSTPAATATPTPTETPTATVAASPTEDDGAGFGVGAALLAMLVGLFAARRSVR